MGLPSNNVGKYQLGRTIGEGTFAKVKLAVDTRDGRYVAIKIIDKHTVMESNLKSQVQREIRTMKLLYHPNIVRINEVIGTKTKIYLVMEYVSGGQLSDKLSYANKLNESDARKVFQQLIDAVDYCHSRGVYHRDLKPENLLLDNKGNVKVSDFGLSAPHQPGGMLTTACGSPCYVAPELLANKVYDGAAADVWSCGVILFELLAGSLPFDDQNLILLYKKISRAEYSCPEWFTESVKRLIARILEPNPRKRITIPEIMEDEWFLTDYRPSRGYDCRDEIHLADVNAAFDGIEDRAAEATIPKSSSFINAFQLIAMSHDLDLSGLFEGQEGKKEMTRLGSEHPVDETIKKIEAAATNISLSVERTNNFKIKMHPKQKMTRSTRSYCDLRAQVIEVTPTNCVVEISKSAGELNVYNEFCKSLSNMLTDKSRLSSQNQENKLQVSSDSKLKQGIESSSEQQDSRDNCNKRGYSSSNEAK